MKTVVVGALMGTLLASGGAIAADAVGAHKAVGPQEIQWVSAPPSLPAGAQQAVLYGDPQKSGMFVLRLKLPKGYKIAPHMHDRSEILTVIAGSVKLGLGPAADHASVEALPAGSFSSMPHGVAHYALVNEDAIVQITAEGPWNIEYVNPKDDPRRNGATQLNQ